MLGKNPSEAAAAALVVMECDILRARGPSAEEIAEAERKKAAQEQAAAEEEAARVEKRRLQDAEIARQPQPALRTIFRFLRGPLLQETPSKIKIRS